MIATSESVAARACDVAVGTAQMRASITGYVLCGGKSSRMGSDKASLVLDGETLLGRAVRCVAAVAGEVRLACGTAARHAELGLGLVLDLRADAGPLAGLEAVLADAAGRGSARVVVLACDMPGATAPLLAGLAARLVDGDLDACLLLSQRGREPLCGAWSTRLLPAVRAALDSGQRTMVSPFDIWIPAQLQTGASESCPAASRAPRVEWMLANDLDPAAVERDVARNVNSPADLEAERRALAEARRP